MARRKRKMSGGRAVLAALRSLENKTCKVELINSHLRMLGNMRVQGPKLRAELRAALEEVERKYAVSPEHPPMKAARASLQD